MTQHSSASRLGPPPQLVHHALHSPLSTVSVDTKTLKGYQQPPRVAVSITHHVDLLIVWESPPCPSPCCGPLHPMSLCLSQWLPMHTVYHCVMQTHYTCTAPTMTFSFVCSTSLHGLLMALPMWSHQSHLFQTSQALSLNATNP